MILGSQTYTSLRTTTPDEVPSLRAERATILADDAADLSAYVARKEARLARLAAVDRALLDDAVAETCLAVVSLDETTAEIVRTHPDTGLELTRTAASDEVLAGFAGEKQPAELQVLAAKLLAARVVEP